MSHPQPGPFRNFAMRMTPEMSAEEAIARATERFDELGRSFVFWVRTDVDQDIEEARPGSRSRSKAYRSTR